MAFMAGANAIFTGEQMLTTPCTCSFTALDVPSPVLNVMKTGSPWDEDKAMMSRWGLEGMRSFAQDNVARKEGLRISSDVPVAESSKGAADASATSQAKPQPTP